MLKKKVIKILTVLTIVSLGVGLIPKQFAISVQAVEKEERATGAIKPTEEQQKWFDENSTKVEDVKYNTLAESRINSERKDRFRTAPKGVEIGDEIVEKGEAKKERALSDNTIILDSVDNSELPCFPEVSSQGSLGSCAAFSTTYYQMTHMVGLKNGWNNKNSNLDTKFSPKWTYNMLNNGYDSGCWPGENIKIFKEVGAATWSDFPYVGEYSEPKNYREWATDSKIWTNAQKYKVDTFGDIQFSSNNNCTPITNPKDTDLNLIKKYLMNGYVLNYLTYVSDGDNSKVKDNPNTKNDDNYVGEYIVTQGGNEGYHSMTLVGYNDDIWVDINNNGKVDNGELGAFKVVNSWGKYYGNDGFAWFAYDSLNRVSSVKGAPSNPNRKESFEDYKVTYFNVKEIKQPKLAVEFTANHSERNQISVEISAKDTSNNKEIPYIEFEQALYNAGGSYSFDGTTTAKEGTFSLDFDKVMQDPRFNEKRFDKWKIKFKDNSTDGKPLEIKDIKLVDDKGNICATPNEELSQSIDGGEQEFTFDYKIGELKKPTLKVEQPKPGFCTVHYDATQPDKSKEGIYSLYENGVLVKSNKGGQHLFGSDDYAGFLEDGVYEYKVVAEDKEGNVVESDVVKIDIKNLVKPVLTVKEMGTPTDGSFMLDLQAKQDTPAGRNIFYNLYENGVLIKSNAAINPLTRGEKTFYINHTKDGVYNYKIETFNLAGNRNVSDVVTVRTFKDAKEWKLGTSYKVGDMVLYENKAYKCTYPHISQENWKPCVDTATLWKELK